MWIFGYGSIIWKPGFDYRGRWPGHIRGWVRRFHQGSTDHRGVPGAPGRVVTLEPEPEGLCWGMLYEVQPEEHARIVARLDHREKGGYRREVVQVHTRRTPPGRVDDVLVYIATDQNPDYLGPAPVPEIAAQIRRSRGPSGPNLEYALELGRALEAMGVEDSHVRAIIDALDG